MMDIRIQTGGIFNYKQEVYSNTNRRDIQLQTGGIFEYKQEGYSNTNRRDF